MKLKTKKLVANLENDKLIIDILAPLRIVLPLSLNKIIVIILRCITDQQGKPLLSFQEISNLLSHPGRQWSNNIYKAWESAGFDLKLFLEDKRELCEMTLNLITQFVLTYPLRSILEQHRQFMKAYPEFEGMCINSFCFYVSAIDCHKLITAFRKQLQSKQLSIRSSYFIKAFLAEGKRISSVDKAYISDLFPEINTFLKGATIKDIDWKQEITQKILLVSLLYLWGVPQKKLSLLFGVSKTTIHNWIHNFCDEGLQGYILKMIGKWSGKICVDDKWIKIKGKWQYVFSAVDAISGLPLLSKRFQSADAASWILFFKEFKMYYPNPTLITSDGSKSLLKGLQFVFPRVRHQLCWFHKLKNLHKRIYKELEEGIGRKHALAFASAMFHNKHISSRKKAARQLALIGGANIGSYLTKSIFNQWLKLTLCLTNNAAERYNRKIEKCIACRYGLKNEACADVIIRGLWFSEILTKGRAHWIDNSGMKDIDLTKILKDNFDGNQIMHFIQNKETQTLKNAG